MIHSVIKEDGVKVESMTKTEIESLVENKNIAENLINTLKEINAGKSLKVWAGNKNEFANEVQDKDVLYFVKDETFFTDLLNRINSLENDVDLWKADIDQLISQINNKYDEYVEKIQQLRDDCCKNPKISTNAIQDQLIFSTTINFNIIPSYSSKTYEYNSGIVRMQLAGGARYAIASYLYIDKENLNKWQNYKIEIKSQGFVSSFSTSYNLWEITTYKDINDFEFEEFENTLRYTIYNGVSEPYMYGTLVSNNIVKITGQF